ncbi:unnamed protein product [Cochlearia groenlandica]
MMMGKEDLGLSLTLGFSQNYNTLQLNINHNSSISNNNLQQSPWNQTFTPSSDLGKIDVNSVPSRLYCDEEAGASSPNSTISSTISGKRSEREGISGDDHGELTPDRGYSRGTSDEEEDGGETSRKKLRLSKDQSAYLEETFKEHNTLNPKQKLALAKKLNLTARQVEVWFQNRRARTKLKQTELTPDRGYSRGTSDEEEDGGGETPRKKLRLSKDQSAYLEETFKEHNTLNPKQKLALAKKLNLTARQVEVWFQNRRARSDISPAHYCKMTLLPL